MSGYGSATPVAERSARLAPSPESAREARRLLREFVAESGHVDWVDAGELAISELVANASLHARTDIELRLVALADRVCVEVRDFSRALPEQRSYGVEATTGRGMGVVATLALDHGVTVLDDGKIVWFCVGDPPEHPGGDLGMWGANEPTTSGSIGPRAELIDLPATLWLSAQQHHDALLREVVLFYAGTGGAPFDVGAASCAQRHLADAVQEQLTAAEAAGVTRPALSIGHPSPLPWVPERLDVPLRFTEDPAVFAVLQDLLDAGERLARDRMLLIRPALPEVVAVRDWACEQVIAQGAGAPASPWSGTAQARFETAGPNAEAVDWDTTFVDTSARCVVAADDSNRIVAVSDPLALLLGWETVDLVGRRVVTLIPPALREAHVAGFTRHLTTGEAHVLGVPLTLPVLRKDGTEVQCHFLVEQVRSSGNRSGYLAWLDPVDRDGEDRTIRR